MKGTVIVDVHEPERLREYLIDLDWKVKVEALKVGDMVRGDTVVERKTIRDLASSINQGRLWKQLRNMNDNYDTCYLAVSGNEHEARSWKQEKSLVKALAKVTRPDSFDVRVIRAMHDRNLMETIDTVLKEKSKTTRPSRVTRSGRTPEEVKADCLMGVKQIGPKTADKLIEEFSTLKEVTNADGKDIAEVIGSARAKRVIKAFQE